ncbi:hypothetical protein HD554DRAFT_1209920 [Boletus coccyginus]|nr:hypothetical protein HD554DRAFT_1209920 [Boletus coccyginus]
MRPFSKRSSGNLRPHSSSSSNPANNKESMAREESGQSRIKFDHGGSPRSFVDHDGRRELENSFRDTVRPGRQSGDANYELSAQTKASEHIPQDKENVTGGVHRSDKVRSSEDVRRYQSSTTGYTSRQYPPALEGPSTTGSREGAEQNVSSSRTLRLAQAASESAHSIPREMADSSSHSPVHRTAEFNKPYETLLREYEFIRGKLEEKRKLLEEKDYKIRFLSDDIAALQRSHKEQSSVLASVRHDYRSCQSQLDNVQRFISTADAHADQDIIQKVQELNEEVYQISMAMVDYVAEGFRRQPESATASQPKVAISESVIRTIGQVTVNYLTAVEGEDIALLLQIAFQGYLSHLLCHIISSWTADPVLNSLIEETYQRLRKSETQAISGRWRSLTRAHVPPTPASEPKSLVEHTLTTLLEVVTIAGLVSLQPDAVSKFSSKFGEKIWSIVSRAGAFGNMVSEMISGDFEVFAVQSGAPFDRESMMMDMDTNKDQAAPRGMGVAQTVLCVSRVGLRKQMGGKVLTLIKAQVVPKSFLD